MKGAGTETARSDCARAPALSLLRERRYSTCPLQPIRVSQDPSPLPPPFQQEQLITQAAAYSSAAVGAMGTPASDPLTYSLGSSRLPLVARCSSSSLHLAYCPCCSHMPGAAAAAEGVLIRSRVTVAEFLAQKQKAHQKQQQAGGGGSREVEVPSTTWWPSGSCGACRSAESNNSFMMNAGLGTALSVQEGYRGMYV